MAASQQTLVQPRLKYLGFFEIAADTATKYVARIYEFAKESSGPLKPGVGTVENTVRTVVGPVYHKIEGKTYEILLFIDRKVVTAADALQNCVPRTVNDMSYQAYGIARQVPDMLISVAAEVHKSGFVETTKSYYDRYEPVAEEWTYFVWKQFLKLPYSVEAVHFVAPTTLFCADKFNQLVAALKKKQMPLVGYVPSLPVKRIEKALKRDA